VTNKQVSKPENDGRFFSDVLKNATKHKLLSCIFFVSFFTVPPSSVEIVDHATGARIPSREGEEVVLQCLVRNAKPAAEIVWFKRNVELKNGKAIFSK